MESATPPSPSSPIRVERWPSEIPLLVFVALASAAIWLLLAMTILGLVYALAIGVFLFFAHLLFVTHVVGSGVKLGPEQFPELHDRVVELARRAGLERAPTAYLMQAGGSLNAFATKLFRGRMIVLFTDLLEACGDDHAARDMVIGHELGHVRAGHLSWHTLLAPGRLLPFLGSAYSRACELTCDRWGAALCGDRGGATRGLAILAAGAEHGPKVNLKAFVDQRRDLDAGWFTLGRWLSTYPPLSERVAAIDPEVAPGPFRSVRGPLRATLLLAALVGVPVALAGIAVSVWVAKMRPLLEAAAGRNVEEEDPAPRVTDVDAARARVIEDFAEIEAVLREHRRETGEAVVDEERLAEVFAARRGGRALPLDPFDGVSYGFLGGGESPIYLFSSGPDGEPGSDDDIDLEIDLVEEGAQGTL